MYNPKIMEVSPHAFTRLQTRLTADEEQLVLERTRTAWDRRDTPSLAVVCLDLGRHETADDGSNGNLVISTVKLGTLVTVMLRNDTQEVKAQRLECKSLAWMIHKRATGPKARKYLNRRRW